MTLQQRDYSDERPESTMSKGNFRPETQGNFQNFNWENQSQPNNR